MDEGPSGNLRGAAPGWPVAVAAALTFGTGALDVLTLTHLGGVFASVMTGNLALMGLGIARVDAATMVHTVTAVLGYAVGVATGSRIIGGRPADTQRPQWPRAVTATLCGQFALLCVFAVGWAMTHGHPGGGVQLGLLAAAAASMGLQSAAMRGLGTTLATTYLTGTLTGLIATWARTPRTLGNSADAAALIAAVCGAACGGVLLMTAPAATPLLTVGSLAAVLATAGYRHHRNAAES